MQKISFTLFVLLNSLLVFVSCKREDEPVAIFKDCYLTSVQTSGDVITNYIYNDQNQLQRTEMNGRVYRRYVYNNNRLVRIETMQGADESFYRIENLKYNDKGLVEKREITYSKPPAPEDIPPYFTWSETYEYNNKNQLIKRSFLNQSPLIDYYKTYDYDQRGNCVKETTFSNQISSTTYAFDTKPNYWKVLNVFPSAYDDFSAVLSTNNIIDSKIIYEYNDEGYITKKSYEGEFNEVFTYNCP